MTFYGEAIAAIRSMVLVDERVQTLVGRVDRLAEDVRAMDKRLVRLETIIEVTRRDGATLRLVPRSDGA